MSRCFIGMGSNLRSPVQQLQRARLALALLPLTRVVACSSIYQSRALTLDDEPQEDYMNAVVELQTELEPEALLDELQAIENQQGRVREKRWGARTLDLDILLYDDLKINSQRLTVPHAEMLNRDFVLIPLHQLAADIEIPGAAPLAVLIEQLDETELKQVGEFDG